MQAAQTEGILGQQVVLDKARVLGLVLRDDREVVVVEQESALFCLITSLGTNRPIAPWTARRLRVILVPECWALIS